MKDNKLLGILIGLVIAVIAFLVLCFGIGNKMEIPDMTLVVGEEARPDYTTEGLDPSKIDSIEYYLDTTDVTVTEDKKLLATDICEPTKCKLVIKSGRKKWVGNFYINTAYRPVKYKNGEVVVGKKGDCPMQVKNTEDKPCYLYLKNNEGGKDYAVMIKPEESIKNNVPVGSYTLYVAFNENGEDWYGPEVAFGTENANYFKRKTELGFTNIKGNITGYKFEVADGEGGKLSLRAVEYSKFPKMEEKKAS